MTAPATTAERRALLSKLHVGKGQLGLDDDTYRDWLEKTIGVRSAKDATDAQIIRAIEAMKALGFGAQSTESAHLRKIRALWQALAELGALRDSSDKALTAFARRQVKIDSLTWIKAYQAASVIEALKSWLAREQAKREAAKTP